MFHNQRPLILGSGSPRRRQLLQQLGLSLVIQPPNVDESHCPGESPATYLRKVIRLKLDSIVLSEPLEPRDAAGVICADTIVCVDGEILQKPIDRDEAARMLTQLSGRRHQVMTAYAIWCARAERIAQRIVSTDVLFRSATANEIEAYVRCGEGDDKAGAYAVQGRGAAFVERIEGSYSNVVGLPLCEVGKDLVELGLATISGKDRD